MLCQSATNDLLRDKDEVNIKGKYIWIIHLIKVFLLYLVLTNQS